MEVGSEMAKPGPAWRLGSGFGLAGLGTLSAVLSIRTLMFRLSRH
jgi:hypothetical protein